MSGTYIPPDTRGPTLTYRMPLPGRQLTTGGGGQRFSRCRSASVDDDRCAIFGDNSDIAGSICVICGNGTGCQAETARESAFDGDISAIYAGETDSDDAVFEGESDIHGYNFVRAGGNMSNGVIVEQKLRHRGCEQEEHRC
eukprot:2922139-Rhodomonas_salina.6